MEKGFIAGYVIGRAPVYCVCFEEDDPMNDCIEAERWGMTLDVYRAVLKSVYKNYIVDAETVDGDFTCTFRRSEAEDALRILKGFYLLNHKE